jgi:hypothetical protein
LLISTIFHSRVPFSLVDIFAYAHLTSLFFCFFPHHLLHFEGVPSSPPAALGQRGWQRAATCATLMPNPRLCTLRPISMRGLEGLIFCMWMCAQRSVRGRILLCLRVWGCHERTRIEGVTHPSLCPHGWHCIVQGPVPMSLAAGLPIAAQLELASQGKTTRHPPLAFVAIGEALAMSGEFLCRPLHQFGVDALPLLRLLHASQRLHHFS